ncbi:MAG: polysaccharide deacetylase family protein [bacterium]
MSRSIPAFFVTPYLAFVMIPSAFAQSASAVVSSNTSPVMAGVTSNSPATMGMQKPQEASSQNGEHFSYSSIHVDGPYIAMTFDDGPNATLTPRLLDILKERHVKVTFFVLGQLVKEHPEIVQRAVAEGHEIGNHSWDHKALNKLGPDGLQHELTDTSAAIKEATGKPVTLMRPPYGATNPRLSRAIEKDFGMKVILWSVDPLDWKDPGPKVVESRILSGSKESGGAKPGAIILSHDIHKGTVEAMPSTLDALLAKGYKFVTVSELLAMESKMPVQSSASPAAPAAH